MNDENAPAIPVPDVEWWLGAWSEREKALTEAYGESLPPGAPPGTVVSMPPELQGEGRVPGGSIYMFPPKPEAKRPHWYFATLGLSQPIRKEDVPSFSPDSPAPSRFGLEWAIAVKEPANWAVIALFSLAQFALKPPAPIKPGARMPFLFAKPKADPEATLENLVPVLGTLPRDYTPAGEIVSLLLWPALDRDGPFVTETGRFDLLVATGITQDEWELAKGTSSLHLLRLLLEVGDGQATDPLRKSALASEEGKAAWGRIAALSRDAILDGLYGPA